MRYQGIPEQAISNVRAMSSSNNSRFRYKYSYWLFKPKEDFLEIITSDSCPPVSQRTNVHGNRKAPHFLLFYFLVQPPQLFFFFFPSFLARRRVGNPLFQGAKHLLSVDLDLDRFPRQADIYRHPDPSLSRPKIPRPPPPLGRPRSLQRSYYLLAHISFFIFILLFSSQLYFSFLSTSTFFGIYGLASTSATQSITAAKAFFESLQYRIVLVFVGEPEDPFFLPELVPFSCCKYSVLFLISSIGSRPGLVAVACCLFLNFYFVFL